MTREGAECAPPGCAETAAPAGEERNATAIIAASVAASRAATDEPDVANLSPTALRYGLTALDAKRDGARGGPMP